MKAVRFLRIPGIRLPCSFLGAANVRVCAHASMVPPRPLGFAYESSCSVRCTSAAAVRIYAKGTSQAGMLAFQFGAARERGKLAKRVSHRAHSRHSPSMLIPRRAKCPGLRPCRHGAAPSAWLCFHKNKKMLRMI